MSTVSEPTGDEAELLRRARSGDDAALETLYTTYVDGARALARRLVGADAADDLVAEAFARVVAQIKAGRGPTSNFRAYLCTTMRNRHADIAPVLQHEQPASDRPWLLDGTESPLEEALTAFDDDEAVAALASLPHSWRQVLWHLEIEGRRVPEVAHLLGTTPAAVSSLAYRAREGLKTAYLAQVAAASTVGGQCGWVRDRLSPFVRGTLGQRAAGRIDTHVPDCASCSGALAQVQQVNSKLAALVVPILLVGVVKGVKGGLVIGGATATSGGVASLLHSPRPLTPTTTATVGVGAVAAAAVVALATVGLPGGDPPDASAPPAESSTMVDHVPATPGSDPPATARRDRRSTPTSAPTTASAPVAATPSPAGDEPDPAEEPGPAGTPDPPPDAPGNSGNPGDDAPPPGKDPAPDPGGADPPPIPPPSTAPNDGPGKPPVDNRGQQVAAEKAAPPALDKSPKQPKPKGQPGPPAHAGGGKK
jgi:RNA polymerase sigma factor (sigma-70 family)